MNFWDVLLYIFWFYILISCIFVFVAVISDIFRDTSLNGWAKAVWIIALVLVPFVSALVYLIARGRGMAARSAERAHAQRSDDENYIRSVSGTSPAADITQAKALLDSGAITQDEFEGLKAKALATA